MLRSIFPDEPVGDQNAASDTDNPGTFFAEFLPTKLKANESSSRQAASSARQAAADAAAAAKASAAEATAAACSAAVCAGQHAAAAANDLDQHQNGQVRDALDAESPFDLPCLCEIRSAVSTALFGTSSEDAQPSTAADGTRGHKDAAAGTESDDEGLFDHAMDSLRRKTADLVPSFRPGRPRVRAAPKPLRLKLAEQVLSKELLSAVQLVEAEIIQSEDALPSATIKFFLKAGRSMGTDWARQNATRIFVFLSGYVAATCGVMHGFKAAAKWLAWRVPRIGKRAAGPAVSFTADVLLPTSFFGPALATYVLVLVICKPKSPKPDGEEGDTTAAAGSDAAAATAADGSTGDKQQQKQQQKQKQQQEVQVTQSLSRELQLEFVVDEPAAQRRLSQWRARRPLVHTSSLRGRMRQAVKARSSPAAAGAPLGPGAEAGEDAGISADVIAESSQEE